MRKTLVILFLALIIVLFSSCMFFKAKIEKISGPKNVITTNTAEFKWKGTKLIGDIDQYSYQKDSQSWKTINTNHYSWSGFSKGAHTFRVKPAENDKNDLNIISWSFIYDPIDEWITYEEVQEGSFKTGSIIYSTDDDYNQLETGKIIKMQLITVTDYDPVINYCAIRLDQTTAESVKFDYIIFKENGDLLSEKKGKVLPVNQSFDFNDDGMGDITYKTLARSNLRKKDLLMQKRGTQMCLLDFTNSPDNQAISLFSYKDSGQQIDPENGIINVNHEGKLLVNSLHFTYKNTGLPTETNISFNKPLPDLYSGDIIIDMKYGVIREIESIDNYSNYTTFQTKMISLPDAFGTIMIHFTGNPMEYEIDKLKQEATGRKEETKKLLDQTIPIFTRQEGKDFIEVMTNFNMTLEMETHVATSSQRRWITLGLTKKVDIDSIYAKMDFSIGNSSTLTAHWERHFQDSDEKKIIEPKIHFAIGPVPCNISIPVTVGYETEFNGTIDTVLGYKFNPGFQTVIKRGDSATSWSYQGTDFYLDKGWTSTELEINGNVNIRPYFNIKAKFGLLNNLIFMGVGIEPYINLGAEGNFSLNSDSRFEAYITPGIRIEAGAGFDAWIFKGEKWIELMNPSIDLWRIILGKPQSPEDFIARYVESDQVIKTNWNDLSEMESGYELLYTTPSGKKRKKEIGKNQESTVISIDENGFYELTLRGFFNCTGIDLKTYSEQRKVSLQAGEKEKEVFKLAGPDNGEEVTYHVIEFEWEGNEEVDNFYIKKDNSGWRNFFESTSYKWPIMKTDIGKSHTFSVKGIKLEPPNNPVYTNIITWNFFICEELGPFLTKQSGPDNGETITQNNAYFSWTASYSEIKTNQIRKDNGSWQDVNNWHYTWFDLQKGHHTFSAKAIDTTGKEAVVTWEFYYDGTSVPTGSLKGRVKDAVSEIPIEGVQVTISPENSSQSAKSYQTQSDADGIYHFDNIQTGMYQILFEKQCFMDAHGLTEIKEGQTVNFPQLLFINENNLGVGDFLIKIIDALNGNPIKNAKVRIRNGLNKKEGMVIEQKTTNQNGECLFRNDAGYYSLEILKDHYNTCFENIVVIGGENKKKEFSLSPVLGEDEIRILLNWGDSPSDLDSHVIKEKNGQEVLHVYWNHLTEDEVNLDRDDIDWFGPETVTISPMDTNGTYKYFIYNFSGEGDYVLSNSEARVTVITAEETYEYNVPYGSGRYWNVFNISNGVIQPVNKISTDHQTGGRFNDNSK